MNDPASPAFPPQQLQQKSPTSGLAIASLVCGILGFGLSFLTGIPAIIMGHMAMSRVKSSNGTLGGGGIALAGTILGYLTTLVIGLIAVLAGLATPAILKAKKSADRAAIEREVGILSSVFENHYSEKQRYPSATEFSAVIQLPSVKKGWEGDWTYFPETPPNTHLPLLISPQSDQKAIVLWSDMDVTQEKSQRVSQIISESKFEYTLFESHH